MSEFCILSVGYIRQLIPGICNNLLAPNVIAFDYTFYNLATIYFLLFIKSQPNSNKNVGMS